MATVNPKPRPKWDVHNPRSALGQQWVKTVRKIYHPVGFRKGYNFPLFVIGVGALMGFVLSRFMYFSWDIFGKSRHPTTLPIGILPGGFLACLQFVPIIRHKALLFHRLNGYLVIVLLLISNAGAYMIMDVAVGGQPNFMVWVGLPGSMTTIGLFLAIYNIKRLQIDVHRAWMLRVWTWAACVVSQRILQIAGIHCADVYGWAYHSSIKCAEIYYMYQNVGVPDQANPTAQLYPACLVASDITGVPTAQQVNPAENTSTFVRVSSRGPGPENVAAAFHNIFPMAAWLALFLHALAIELYLWLTPAESYRLRTISYEKQIEKGMRQKGAFKDAGTTNTRIGDAPEWWSIPGSEYEEQKRLIAAEELARANKLGEGQSGTESDSGNTLVGVR